MNQHWRNKPRPQIGPVPEHLTYAGAHKLAQRIRDYWEAEGKTPEVSVARETNVRAWQARSWDQPFKEDTENPGIWVVRSDMLNGLPR